jgi:hypothetical protein
MPTQLQFPLEETAVYVKAFIETKKFPRLNEIIRQTIDASFHANNTRARFGADYYHHISQACNKNYRYNFATWGPAKLAALTDALQKEILDDEELFKEYNKDADMSEKTSTVQAVSEVEKTEDTSVKLKDSTITAGLKFEVDVAGILFEAAKQYLSSDSAGILNHVDGKIKEEAMKLRPNQIVIAGRPPVEIKGKLHACFKPLVQILQYEKQAFLVGPAGTGKTTLASQAAKAFDIPFAHISCTAGMSEGHLMGRMIADGSYISSEFISLYEGGGVFLFDEVDAADPNTLLIINSALANGYMSVPNRKDNPRAVRHADFYAICAANTYGNGSNQYAGRSVLDAAFLDRFCMGKLEVNYDVELERTILERDPSLAAKLWKVRSNIENSKLRRVLSTRAFVSSAVAVASGNLHTQIFERFFTGWTREEQTKATQGILL